MAGLDVTVRDVDVAATRSLASALGVRPVTARCLSGRGIHSAADGQAFLSPKLAELRRPAGLADLERATARIAHAVTAGQTIGVFGDYDVDGVTTAALATSFLRRLGARVVPRVAKRAGGYGFGVADLAHFVGAGCNLIVTGDCGTSDIATLASAADQGIDVVVVDHHTVPAPTEQSRHPAFALINPFRTDSTFPFRGMASVGLMFYVMQVVRSELRQRGFFGSRPAPDLREWLDLVAIGTVADLVPLSEENRIMTRYGLDLLSRTTRPGIRALLDRAEVKPGDRIDERTIGWRLAPRLNAPGRIGDAAPSLELLLAGDREQADHHADVVEQANEARRTEQDRVLEQALEALEGADIGPAVVVAGEGWTHGVVGIVAARLVDMLHRPAFVIAVDPSTGEGRGSARSFGGVNLYDVLSRCSDRLLRFGGHAAAAGLTVRASEIPALREQLCAAVTEAGVAPRAAAVADAEVSLADVDLGLADELLKLSPFGQGNDKPMLLARDLEVVDSRAVGSEGTHLVMTLRDRADCERRAIAFGQADNNPGVGARVETAFTPSINEFRGTRKVELTISEFAATP